VGVEPGEGLIQAGVGQIGQVGSGGGQVGHSGQIAPGDAHHLLPAEAPQAAGEIFDPVRPRQAGRQP
jgi:hypothetical protein